MNINNRYNLIFKGKVTGPTIYAFCIIAILHTTGSSTKVKKPLERRECEQHLLTYSPLCKSDKWFNSLTSHMTRSIGFEKEALLHYKNTR